MATQTIVTALQQESQQLGETLRNINKLRVRKQKVDALLGEYRGASSAPITRRRRRRSPRAKNSETQLRIAGVKRAGSTMNMARQILIKNGQPMSSGEIHKAIVDSFGATPASSLTQMLYKRARANSSFYRTKDGKYGLMEATHNRAA